MKKIIVKSLDHELYYAFDQETFQVSFVENVDDATTFEDMLSAVEICEAFKINNYTLKNKFKR